MYHCQAHKSPTLRTLTDVKKSHKGKPQLAILEAREIELAGGRAGVGGSHHLLRCGQAPRRQRGGL